MKERKFDPETFPAEEVIKMISDEYGISPAEFNSTFKYGSLPEARQLYCKSLLSAGLKNKDISELTGYSPGRVSVTIESANKLILVTPFFKLKHDMLVRYLLTIII